MYEHRRPFSEFRKFLLALCLLTIVFPPFFQTPFSFFLQKTILGGRWTLPSRSFPTLEQ